MITGIDPKVDYAFKRVFGMQRNLPVLMHILNAVLVKFGHVPITSLALLNPFNEKETSGDKLSVVDLRAQDILGRFFNIEMQMLYRLYLPERILYYWSRSYAQQLAHGDEYHLLKPTVSICFLNENLYKDNKDRYHSCFRLQEEGNSDDIFSSHLEIHLLELPKFQLTEDELHHPLDKWLYFLKNAAILDTESLPTSLRVPEIELAMKELSMVTQSEIDRARYEERFKAEMDALYLQNEAKRDREKLDRLKRLEEEMARMESLLVEAKEKVAKSREEAEKSREEAEKSREASDRSREAVRNQTVRTIEFCQKLLGVVRTPREDLLKLSLPELQQIAERLQDQVDAR